MAWGFNSDGQTNVPASATNVIAVGAGYAYSVALQSNGTVVAWGNNDYGQTNPPAYLTNVIAIAVGYNHALALLGNNEVVSWGSQDLVPAAATNVLAIAAGWEHNLALRGDGTIIAWGDNSYGQCSVPAYITNAVAIAAGYGSSLAILGNGTTVAWGQNYFVSPNNPEFDHGEVAIPTGLNNVAAISCGENHEVGIINLGLPQTFRNPLPIPANVGGGALLGGYLAGSYPMTYQWYQNGQTVIGATNRWLQLENLQATDAGMYTEQSSNLVGTATSDPINLAVSSAPYFTAAFPVQQNVVVGTPVCLSVSPSGAESLDFQTLLNGTILADGGAISGTGTPFICFNPATYADDGSLNLLITNSYGSFSGLVADLVVTPIIAWGDNSSGQLWVPSRATNVVSIAAGGDHSLALRADGSIVAWGDNTYGQNQVPSAVTGVVAVAEGDTDSLVLKSDGTIIAWGDNTYGQTNVPGSAFGAVQLAAGSTASEALMPNGSVVYWSNQYFNIPPSATNVVSIAARGSDYLALRSDGSVISWGITRPPILTNAIAIAAGDKHGLALLGNSSVAAWGDNTYGQTAVPPSVTNIVAIAAGDYNSMALRADGALIAWGYTNYNQTPVPTLTPSIMTIGAGSLHNLAVIGQTPTVTVSTGGSTLLTSGNLGSGLGAFQWLYNGVGIAGATNSSLWLTNLQWFNSGLYQVVVANPLQVVKGPAVNVIVPAAFQFDLSSFVYQPASGSVALRLIGASGSSPVIIYASSNLMDWQAIFTNAPTVNPIDFTDTSPTNAPQRFYRASQ